MLYIGYCIIGGPPKPGGHPAGVHPASAWLTTLESQIAMPSATLARNPTVSFNRETIRVSKPGTTPGR